ncbi:MAG: hypothetical protein ACR2HY_06445 [Acidimicrobiales bacterium]
MGTETITVVVDGRRWWSWSPLLGAKAGGPDVPVGLGPGLTLLEGRRLLSALGEFEMTGKRPVGSRRGVIVRARPLGSESDDLDQGLTPEMPAVSWGPLLSELGDGADTYELTIDEELGILLRVEACLDGQPFRVCEMRELVVDQAVPAELMSLTPPDGASFEVMRPEHATECPTTTIAGC